MCARLSSVQLRLISPGMGSTRGTITARVNTAAPLAFLTAAVAAFLTAVSRGGAAAAPEARLAGTAGGGRRAAGCGGLRRASAGVDTQPTSHLSDPALGCRSR